MGITQISRFNSYLYLLVLFDEFLEKIKNKIKNIDEFSWSKGYGVDCIESPRPYDENGQRVWISKKDYLLIEAVNFNEDIRKKILSKPRLDYYQNFLTEDGKIKDEAYKLRIKFKKKHTLYALSLVCIMLLCSEVEQGDRSGAKIYINNKMLPIFSEFDINIPEWKNYSQLGAEALHIDKDVDYVVNIITDEIKEENEFYITGADIYSIYIKSICTYDFDRPDMENGFLHNLEYERQKNL